MKIDFSQVYEGWRNNLVPPAKLKKAIKEVAKDRISICKECPLISTKHKTFRMDVHCTDCGCTLSAKTKCLSCSCPLNKWLAVVEENIADELKQL
jgi:hypothetical protein